MRPSLILFLVLLLTSALPAAGHTGTENMHQHFYEHVLIALMIGIPLVIGLLMAFARHSKSDDE
jgi:hypothetical protein